MISIGLDLNGFMQQDEYLDHMDPNSTDDHEDFIDRNEFVFQDVECIFYVYDGILEFEETVPKWIGETMKEVFCADFHEGVRWLAEQQFNREVTSGMRRA